MDSSLGEKLLGVPPEVASEQKRGILQRAHTWASAWQSTNTESTNDFFSLFPFTFPLWKFPLSPVVSRQKTQHLNGGATSVAEVPAVQLVLLFFPNVGKYWREVSKQIGKRQGNVPARSTCCLGNICSPLLIEDRDHVSFDFRAPVGPRK